MEGIGITIQVFLKQKHELLPRKITKAKQIWVCESSDNLAA
jgi:hypothetical protein